MARMQKDIIIIIRYPADRLAVAKSERNAWNTKKRNPKVKLYRYAFIGEAAQYNKGVIV